MHSRDLLTAAAAHAADFLETLPDGRVEAEVLDADALRARLALELGDAPTDARTVLDELVEAATPGLVRSQSPRYFGYVIGGTLPAALAADVVVAGWDQNAGGYSVSPAASVVEEVAGGWLIDLLGLPAERVVRPDHRLPAGARHVPGRRAQRGARRRRLGRRGRRAAGRAAGARC